MKKIILSRILMTLALLFGAVSAASAADRLYMDDSYVLPGQSRTLALQLENAASYFGFQTNISLPTGLRFSAVGDVPSVNLSARMGSDFSLVSNLQSPQSLSVGAFSPTHTAISGNYGALLYFDVIADDAFAGGEITLSNTHFTTATDSDVAFDNVTVNVRNQTVNSCYLPDLSIAVTETKKVSVMLDNETPFSAFQADLYLPEGFSIKEGSFATTSRTSAHTLSTMTFSDGRTRIICFSESAEISAGTGAILEFEVCVYKDVAEACSIQLKNLTFSTSDAIEYFLPNTSANVTVSGALVSEIILNAPNTEMHVGESLTLSATVLPDNATNKAIEWVSSNPEVATVSATGEVNAVALGETVITVTSVADPQISAQCSISVVPTLVSSITLSESTLQLMTPDTFKLEAEVGPADATDKSVSWTSSNNAVATVDESGNITAVGAGEAEIKVMANDASGVYAICLVAVTNPVLGDSNVNGVVNVADAVNTANYAIGKKVERFNTVAADVNLDGTITMADASATITLILKQPVPNSVKSKSKAHYANDSADMLVIDDYSAKVGETVSVFVTLKNTFDYVALQGDIIMPQGVTLETVNIGNRAKSNHTLFVKSFDANTMRIVLFDTQNSAFAANDEAIIELVVKVDKATTGLIKIDNIVASDAQAYEYTMTASGGAYTEMSGADSIASSIRIAHTADGIQIANACGQEIVVCGADGIELHRFTATSDLESLQLTSGLYVVSAGSKVAKVMVK